MNGTVEPALMEAREPEQTWLSSMTFGDYPGLETTVTIDLAPRRTVLVGRNGAGKSLLLDAMQSVANGPHASATPILPNRFRCTIDGHAEGQLGYEFARAPRVASSAASPKREGSPFVVSERAWRVREGREIELWRSEHGTVTFPDGSTVRTSESYLVYWPDTDHWPADDEAFRIAEALKPVARIASGVPRSRATREVVLHRLSMADGRPTLSDEPPRAGRLRRLSRKIAALGLREPASTFDELVEATRRVGVARSMHLARYEATGQPRTSGVCEVLVDGVNLGLLSDGTLRVLETLLRLHDGNEPRLLLEEPETGIHPALLARLLREIESYEGQVIVSTHSPQVVSWAKPEDIRLVERTEGRTTVRSLDAAEFDRVHEYLSHDGTLGEFVYGGALDDED